MVFTKLSAITLQIYNKSTIKPQGAQLQKLINISVNFYDSRSNTFWATHDTSFYLVKG
jgi:hypothetical protein